MHSYSQNLSNRFPQIWKKKYFLSSSRNLPVVMSLRGTDASRLVTTPLDRCWLCPKGWFCVCYLPTMWKVQQGSENIYSANRRLKCSASLRAIFFFFFLKKQKSFLDCCFRPLTWNLGWKVRICDLVQSSTHSQGLAAPTENSELEKSMKAEWCHRQNSTKRKKNCLSAIQVDITLTLTWM